MFSFDNNIVTDVCNSASTKKVFKMRSSIFSASGLLLGLDSTNHDLARFAISHTIAFVSFLRTGQAERM